jgi:hypothetical protein
MTLLQPNGPPVTQDATATSTAAYERFGKVKIDISVEAQSILDAK